MVTLLFGMGALFYASANIIAYNVIVDDVKASKKENKNNKGVKKFLTGFKNVVSNITYGPAFATKTIVEKVKASATPEKNMAKVLSKKIKEKKSENLYYHDQEYVKDLFALTSSKMRNYNEEEKRAMEKSDFQKIVDDSCKIIETKTKTRNEFDSAILEKFDNVNLGLIERKFTEGKYHLEEDTPAQKAAMNNISYAIKDKIEFVKRYLNDIEKINDYEELEQFVEKNESKAITSYHDASKVIDGALDRVVEAMVEKAGAFKDMISSSKEILSNKLIYNMAANIQKEYEKEENEYNKYLPAYKDIIEKLKANPNLDLDVLIEEYNEAASKLSNKNEAKEYEILLKVTKLGIKLPLAFQLTELSKSRDIILNDEAFKEVKEKDRKELIQMIDDLEAAEKNSYILLENYVNKIYAAGNIKHLLKEKKGTQIEKIAELEKTYDEVLSKAKESLEQYKKDALTFEQIFEIYDDYLDMLNVPSQAKTLKNIFLSVVDERRTSPELVNYYYLKEMTSAYLDNNGEEYKTLMQKLNKIKIDLMNTDTAYEEEVAYQNELAMTIAKHYGTSLEQAYNQIKDDFYSDKYSQKTMKNLFDIETEYFELEEEVEEPAPSEEEVEEPAPSEEVVVEDFEPEAEVEEPAQSDDVEEPTPSDEVEPVVVAEEPIVSTDLSDGTQQIIKVQPVKNFKKVSYRKYEAVELTDEQYNRLNDKKKFIYNMVKENQEQGLPVGIFTAMGIKQSQINKIVKPCGEKFEKDFDDNEYKKVLNIINENLNNNLYISTNGNERIKVVRNPIDSLKVSKERIAVIDNINSKYKVCLVKGLSEESKEELKNKFGDKISFYKEYIIFNTDQKDVVKETKIQMEKC